MSSSPGRSAAECASLWSTGRSCLGLGVQHLHTYKHTHTREHSSGHCGFIIGFYSETHTHTDMCTHTHTNVHSVQGVFKNITLLSKKKNTSCVIPMHSSCTAPQFEKLLVEAWLFLQAIPTSVKCNAKTCLTIPNNVMRRWSWHFLIMSQSTSLISPKSSRPRYA